MLGSHNRYSIFFQLRAQYKFESKCHYLHKMLDRLCVNPKSFWEFVRSKRDVSTIPDEVHLGESKASIDQVASLFGSHFSSVYSDPRFTSNDLSDEFTNNLFSHLSSKLSISIDEVNAALNFLSNARSNQLTNMGSFKVARLRLVM
jgi:hypothetical protein